MLLAWEHLVAERRVEDAVEAGAVCLGVCAGFQLLSVEFSDRTDAHATAWGCWTSVAVASTDRAPSARCSPRARHGFLTGFENHQGDARLGTGGPAARPPSCGRRQRGRARPRVPCRAG